MKPIWQRFALALILLCGSASFAAGPASTGFQFDIPAASLGVAMEKWAATIGGDVVFDAYSARVAQTRQVRGQMSPESALNQMLAGTDLSYTYNAVARRAVITRRRASVASPAPTPAPRAAAASGGSSTSQPWPDIPAPRSSDSRAVP